MLTESRIAQRQRHHEQLTSETPERKWQIADVYLKWLVDKPQGFSLLRSAEILPYERDVLARAFLHIIANTDSRKLAEGFAFQLEELSKYQDGVNDFDFTQPTHENIDYWIKDFNFQMFRDFLPKIEADRAKFSADAKKAMAVNPNFFSPLKRLWHLVTREGPYSSTYSGFIEFPPRNPFSAPPPGT